MPISARADGVSALIDFVGLQAGDPSLRLAFREPIELLVARIVDEVGAVLDAAQRHAEQGHWCVGFVRYEAAAAFDSAFELHPAESPLAWFAVYRRPIEWPAPAALSQTSLQWQERLSRAEFDTQIAQVHEAIANGEVYQINLTSCVASSFDGSPRALFEALHRAQPNAYAAFIDCGDEQVLSVSPELFFDWRGDNLLVRPMKGTAPRGHSPEEDEAQSQHLLNSEKERAENLMIVDLIRNDLSRIALPFSVQVPALFERRAWPTVWQMTSDVTARSRPGLRLSEVFGALFPCGSVTGAPKVRAMHWIRQLEAQPRGIYCGAIGVLRPGGAATFSVGIRTVVVRSGQASCGIGSGITADANASAEWREWRDKRAFLERAREPFQLLQTLRLQDGQFPAIDAHLGRLVTAAAHFGYLFDSAAARQALATCAGRHPQGLWRVRLLVDARGSLTVEAFALEPTATPVKVALAPTAFVKARSEFVRFKTTLRTHYDAMAPQQPGVFDTLLWNTDGEVTEFTRGNLAALIDGRWITPPLRCGLLNGVGRERALLEGRVAEAVLRVEDLPRVQAMAFVNGLRGWLEAELTG
jgi:para-aminobenzoate synthetase/4-amino-4-deoxychorismate lyase